MAVLNLEQTRAYAGADPAGFIALMADLYFPRASVRDTASCWRNRVRQSLKNLAGLVRQEQLSPTAAADLIHRRFSGDGSQTTRHTSSIVAILREAHTTPDPQVVAQARRLLKHYAPAAKKAARDRAATPPPEPRAGGRAPQSTPTQPAAGPADLSGEVIGLDQSIGYATSLAGFAGAHGPAGNEGYLDRLAAAQVTGDGLTSGQAMQDAFAAAAAAAATHAAALDTQKTVQQAYDQAPHTGDKTYLTGSADPTPPTAGPYPPPPAR